MSRRRTDSKLKRTDPAWRRSRFLWGTNAGSGIRKCHRITAVATPNGAAAQGQTECGVVLLRVAMHAEPPADAEFCDACLLGEAPFPAVYVFTEPDGKCIYVGCSVDLPARIQSHRRESLWWRQDLILTYTIHPDERAALAAETEAILRLKPEINQRAVASGPKLGTKRHTLHVRLDVLTDLLSEALGQPADTCLAACHELLGIQQSTFWRIRHDPNYAIGSSFVAGVAAAFGPEAMPRVFEARLANAA